MYVRVYVYSSIYEIDDKLVAVNRLLQELDDEIETRVLVEKEFIHTRLFFY